MRDFQRRPSAGGAAHAPGLSRIRSRRLLLEGNADVGIATEALAEYDELVALPCYSWTHVVVVPPDHELADLAQRSGALTLQQLVRFPIVTYESGYTGRAHIDQAFTPPGSRPTWCCRAHGRRRHQDLCRAGRWA